MPCAGTVWLSAWKFVGQLEFIFLIALELLLQDNKCLLIAMLRFFELTSKDCAIMCVDFVLSMYILNTFFLAMSQRDWHWLFLCLLVAGDVASWTFAWLGEEEWWHHLWIQAGGGRWTSELSDATTSWCGVLLLPLALPPSGCLHWGKEDVAAFWRVDFPRQCRQCILSFGVHLNNVLFFWWCDFYFSSCCVCWWPVAIINYLSVRQTWIAWLSAPMIETRFGWSCPVEKAACGHNILCSGSRQGTSPMKEKLIQCVFCWTALLWMSKVWQMSWTTSATSTWWNAKCPQTLNSSFPWRTQCGGVGITEFNIFAFLHCSTVPLFHVFHCSMCCTVPCCALSTVYAP